MPRSFTEELEETEVNEYIKNETFRIVMQTLEDLPPGSRNVFSRGNTRLFCQGDR